MDSGLIDRKLQNLLLYCSVAQPSAYHQFVLGHARMLEAMRTQVLQPEYFSYQSLLPEGGTPNFSSLVP